MTLLVHICVYEQQYMHFKTNKLMLKSTFEICSLDVTILRLKKVIYQ